MSKQHICRGGPTFPKGVSGNPGGRPKGFGAFIREETNDGVELVQFVLAVMRDPTWDPRARLFAASWLADRGFGKPPQAEAPKLGEDRAKRFALPPETAVLVYKAYLRGEMTMAQEDGP